MVMRIAYLSVLLGVAACSWVNPVSRYTEARAASPDASRPPMDAAVARPDASQPDLDAAIVPLDASPTLADAEVVLPDASLSPPEVRVLHLARRSAAANVFADDVPITESPLAFEQATSPNAIEAGSVTFRVDGMFAEGVPLQETFEAEPGRRYTLVIYGDEGENPALDRGLALLWVPFQTSEFDTSAQNRLTAIHVATPVIEGRLVAVGAGGMLTGLVDDFGYPQVASPLILPSLDRYDIAFDAGNDRLLDVRFRVEGVGPGADANVFVASRDNGDVFLLLMTPRSEPRVIESVDDFM